MLKSDICFIASTIYIAISINVLNSSLIIRNLTAPTLAMFLAFVCIMGMIYAKYLERLQYIRFKKDIEEYNKQMEDRFKNGRSRR